MKTPFFSVIIPSFNRRAMLKIAVASVLNQSFSDFEVIVVDDGSTDGTRSCVESIGDPRIIYLYQHNRGVSGARNRGIALARGQYIAFLDSDDRFRIDKLATTKNHIAANPQYRVFHSREIWYRGGSYREPKKHHAKPHGWVFEKAVRACCISPSAVTIDKKIFAAVGGFDETLPACEDYELWLRVTSRYPVFLIPEFLTIKEGGRPDQLSRRYPAMDRFRIYALEKIIASGVLTGKELLIARRELAGKKTILEQGAKKRENSSRPAAISHG